MSDIGLIICDVDGTLLKPFEKEVSCQVLSMIEKASRKIHFALASGRSENGLKRLFGENERIFYISSDGAKLTQNNRILYQKPIPHFIILDFISKLKNVDFVLYSDSGAYASCEDVLNKIIKEENQKSYLLQNLKKDSPIYKVAVFSDNEGSSYGEHYVLANKLLRLCYSSQGLREYVMPDADKGLALEFLQKQLNFKYEETAAFGDNLNDIPMLKKAFYSYRVSGAKPELYPLCRFYTNDATCEIETNFLK